MKKTLIFRLLLVCGWVQAQTTLSFTFSTGTDDLRGGNDNVNVIILLHSGRSIRFDNVNEGRRLPDATIFGATRTLPANVTENDVRAIQLETTFGGGIFGDNWNLNDFQVNVNRNASLFLVNERGTPLMRFTGSNRSRTFLSLLRSNTPTPPVANLMLDADFRRPGIPSGPLENISNPPYAELISIPAKPFPGSIVGDFFAIRGNTSFFTIGADPQDAAAARFLLVPHLPAAPTHYPYVDLISQPVTEAIRRRQFRATLVFKAMNEVRDQIRFIINDPNEVISQEGFGNGILSIWLQNGIIYAKTDDPAQARLEIGRFQVMVQTQIEVNFSLLPSTALQTVVTAGSAISRTDFRTPAQSWATANGGLGRIAWLVKPPSYLPPRPARLQEFRLISAQVQLL